MAGCQIGDNRLSGQIMVQVTDANGKSVVETFYSTGIHDEVIKWKHFPRYWPFVRGIHRSPVNSPYKGQWRGALIFSLICVWINGWVSNHEAADLRRYRAYYDVSVMRSINGEEQTSVWRLWWFCRAQRDHLKPYWLMKTFNTAKYWGF